MLIIEELFRIVDAFAANQLEYAVCGGLAVAIHGRPRLTVDIDFVVDGRRIQSLSRTALITMKRDSDRTKDKLDIELLNDKSD